MTRIVIGLLEREGALCGELEQDQNIDAGRKCHCQKTFMHRWLDAMNTALVFSCRCFYTFVLVQFAHALEDPSTRILDQVRSDEDPR
jgi:hypothetical protein